MNASENLGSGSQPPSLIPEAEPDGSTGDRPPGGWARAARLAFTGTTSARVLGAAAGLLAARLLGPTLRGEYAVALTLATIGAMLSTGGLQYWVVVNVGSGKRDRFVASLVHRHAVVVICATGVAVAIAIATRSPFGVDPLVLLPTSAYSCVAALGMVFMGAPLGAHDMRPVAVGPTIGAAFFALGVGGLLALDVASVAMVMLFSALSSLISAAVGFASFRSLTAAPSPRSDFADWRTAIRRFGGAGISEVVLLAMLRVDFLLVAAFLPLEWVGLYAVAASLTEMLWIIPDAGSQIALSMAGATSEAARIPRLFRLAIAATAAAGVALSVASPHLLPILFGPDFARASRAVPLLALAAVAGGAWKIVTADVTARGRPSTRLVTALLGLVTMSAIDLVAIPRHGIVGASLGSAVGYTAAAVAASVSWARLPGNRARDLIRFRLSDLQSSRGATGREQGARS